MAQMSIFHTRKKRCPQLPSPLLQENSETKHHHFNIISRKFSVGFRLLPQDSLPWFNMGVSKNGGTPKWMVYNGKPYEQMDDLGGFNPRIFGNTHLLPPFPLLKQMLLFSGSKDAEGKAVKLHPSTPSNAKTKVPNANPVGHATMLQDDNAMMFPWEFTN